jgi:type IV pilus assembly protein PilV
MNMHTAVKNTLAGRKNERGMVLVELMIAVVVLSIGILAMMSMQVASIRTNASARRITQSAVIATDRLEKLMGLPYDHALLAANSNHVVVDGRYTIRWTVSDENDPITNVKTVTVTVSTLEAGEQRSTVHVYYKAI